MVYTKKLSTALWGARPREVEMRINLTKEQAEIAHDLLMDLEIMAMAHPEARASLERMEDDVEYMLEKSREIRDILLMVYL